MYHYHQLFHKSGKDERKKENKLIYYLYFAQCFIISYICVQQAFGRSNLLTNRSPDSYTALQCASLHFSQYTLIVLYYMCVYTLFIYRIQIVFDNTCYKYPTRVYYALYIGLVVGAIISLTLLYISLPDTKFVLYYFKTPDHVYCDSMGSKAGKRDRRTVLNYIGSLFFVLQQTIYNILLLYMFTHRLNELQTELLQQYMSESPEFALESTVTRSTIQLATSSPSAVSPNEAKVEDTSPALEQSNGVVNGNESGDRNEMLAENENHLHAAGGDVSTDEIVRNESTASQSHGFAVKRAMTVGDLIDGSKKDNQSVKRIFNLHKMIKKFAILVWVQVLSNVLWTVLLVAVSEWMWVQLAWVFAITNTCIWLMFHFSYRYYKLTTRYCVCYLCYCNKSKDISSRHCLC